jgi:hypothetical protein
LSRHALSPNPRMLLHMIVRADQIVLEFHCDF